MKKVNSGRLKFGANNYVILIFAIVIVILLNSAAKFAEDRFPVLKIDLTQSAITKITDETKSLLKTLDEGDVKIELVYLKGTGDESRDVVDVLRQYDVRSENVSFSTENYVKNPTVLKTYGISSPSEDTVVVTNAEKTRYKVITSSEMWSYSGSTSTFLLESKITNAIGYIMNGRSINAVMSSGHDEAVNDYLAQMLTEENVSVTELDLSTADIPENTDVFFILAPQSDYTKQEVDALDDYLSGGGNAVVSFSFNVNLPHLEEYVSEWGLTAEDDVLIEQSPSKSYRQAGMYFYPTVTQSEITSSVTKNIFASYARSMTYSQTGDIYAEPILTTSPEAYSVPVSMIGNEDFDADEAEEGQFNIGYLLEKPLDGSYDKTAKLIVTSTPSVWGAINAVYSDYDYVALASLSEPRFGNGDLVMNAVSYMTGVDRVIYSVPSKVSTTAIMSLSSRQSAILRLVLCIALPLSVIAAGLIVWLKRRHL